MRSLPLKQMTVMVVFTTLLCVVRPGIAQEATATEAAPAIPPRGSVWMSTAKEIWQLDPETGGKLSQGTEIPQWFIARQVVDYQDQKLYRIDRTSTDPLPYIGEYEVVEIDMTTNEERVIFQGKNPWSITANPSNKDYLILAYIPQGERMSRDYTPEHCILNLRISACTQINKDAAIQLFQFGPIYWLDEKTFTDGNAIFNALTGEKKRILDGWVVWSFVQMQETNDLLVVARTQDGEMPWNGGAGFYRMDLTTFQLSEKLCDAPPFDSIFTSHLSSDNNLIQFVWQYNAKYHSVILDLESCQTRLDTNQFASLRWLPGGHKLLGQVSDAENNPRAVVRIDADTGEITTLFYMNERVTFTVLQ